MEMLGPVIFNFIYAILGGSLTMGFMWMGCKMFSHIVNFDISDELAKGNQAVGMMVMGIFIGIGISTGLVIGMGMN
jgi:hypothetical protein